MVLLLPVRELGRGPSHGQQPVLRCAPPQKVELFVAPTAVAASERKTGLYVPNVETPQLVRDERGWLRLAEVPPHF